MRPRDVLVVLHEPRVGGATTAVLRALNVTTRTQAVVAAGKIGLHFPGVEGRMVAS